MSDICESAEEPTNLFEDNQGTIAMPVCHSRTKHIDIKYNRLVGSSADSQIAEERNPSDLLPN